MKIKTEFSARNLTIFGGYSNIFSFFTRSKIFDKLDTVLSLRERKKIYTKLDYIKILMTMLTFGFKNMNQVSLFNTDSFILKLLDLERVPHASNLARFLKNFTFKHCQQVIEVKKELFKKFHKKAFHLKKLTLDLDSTILNLWGHPEGAEKGYNDSKRGNRSYHPVLAFIHETKEMIHGVLKPGNTHCSNGAVEFIKEIKSMLPYGIRTITLRADSGFFGQALLDYLEAVLFDYVIAVKNYPTIIQKIINIPESAYSLFEDNSEIAVFHFRLNNWNIKRKFIVVRTLLHHISPQMDLFGTKQYSYQTYVTTLHGDPKNIVRFYRKRGNAENYIKELKYDMNIGKLITDSFWANQTILQFSILSYNLMVWFKNIFIGKSERRTTIRTFRERFLLIPSQMVKRSRQFVLKLPKHYKFKEKFKCIEMQLA